MTDDDLTEWLADRTEALLSLDPEKVNAYLARYGSPPLPPGETGLAAIHKARTAVANFPEAEKEISRRWLKAHGMRTLE